MEVLWLIHFFLMLRTVLALYCMTASWNSLNHAFITLFCCYCCIQWRESRGAFETPCTWSPLSCCFGRIISLWGFLVHVLPLTQTVLPQTMSWRHCLKAQLPVQQLNSFSAVSSSQLPLSDCRAERKRLRENVSYMREVWRNGLKGGRGGGKGKGGFLIFRFWALPGRCT